MTHAAPADVADELPDDVRLLVVIPTLDEFAHARVLLGRLAVEVAYDTLFVDDASTDGTSDLLADAAERGEVFHVRHDTNRGYGAALVTGFDWAHARGYDWVVTMDCDEQHDPANLPAFVAAIADDDADLISGTRYTPGLAGDLPPPERRLVNLVLTSVANDLFGWTLTDTFCGFKAHRVGPTTALDLDEAGYAFPMQLWPRVFADGLRVREIPVRRIYNDPNRSFGTTDAGVDLDDARTRLRHYLAVLRDELCRLDLPPLRDALPAVTRDVFDRLAAVPGESAADRRRREDLRAALSDGLLREAALPCP